MERRESEKRLKGTICSVSGRGYGFIQTSGADVFFHASAVKSRGGSSLYVGAPVEFRYVIDEQDGRPRAVDIVMLSDSKGEVPTEERKPKSGLKSFDQESDTEESESGSASDRGPAERRTRTRPRPAAAIENGQRLQHHHQHQHHEHAYGAQTSKSGRRHGTICSLCPKGYGFIQTEEGDVYLHSTSMLKPGSFDSLHIGDCVTFEITHDGKDGKIRAAEVLVTQKASHSRHRPPAEARLEAPPPPEYQRESRRRGRDRGKKHGISDLPEHTGPERVRGKVCSLSGKGFGFIKTDNGDVYVHSSGMLKPGTFDSLRVGSAVEFTISTDGKARAEDVVIVQSKKDRETRREEDDYRRDKAPPRLQGVICSLHDRGYGFIRTPDGDVYVHSSGLKHPMSFDDLQVGMPVEFNLSRSGKVRAENVAVIGMQFPAQSSAEGPADPESGSEAVSQPDRVESSASEEENEDDEEVEILGQHLQGAICSLSGRGFGFISTPNGDVYIHSSGMREAGSFGGLSLGTRVEFVLKKSLRDGAIFADDVVLLADPRSRRRATDDNLTEERRPSSNR